MNNHLNENQKYKILIVDSSADESAALRNAMSAHCSYFDFIADVRTGNEALAFLQNNEPDLILMEVELPIKDGIEVTREILTSYSTRVLLMTPFQKVASTKLFDSLGAGAVGVTIKSHATDMEIYALINSINNAVKAALPQLSCENNNSNILRPKYGYYKTLAIGCSAGGPVALAKVLGDLPETLNVPIVVVQHISEGFTKGLVETLDEHAKLHVKLAEHDEVLLPGKVYVAPDKYQTRIVNNGNLKFSINDPIVKNGFAPSVDETFLSVAQACKARAFGIILTGMGRDGALGLKSMHDAGALTIVQDKKSALVYGMPNAALEIKAVDHIVNINHMGTLIRRLLEKDESDE